jgi:hypothetical protein
MNQKRFQLHWMSLRAALRGYAPSVEGAFGGVTDGDGSLVGDTTTIFQDQCITILSSLDVIIIAYSNKLAAAAAAAAEDNNNSKVDWCD